MGTSLKLIKKLVTFHLGKKIIKTHMGMAIKFASEKTSVGVILLIYYFEYYSKDASTLSNTI